jgi:hypothetical protein
VFFVRANFLFFNKFHVSLFVFKYSIQFERFVDIFFRFSTTIYMYKYLTLFPNKQKNLFIVYEIFSTWSLLILSQISITKLQDFVGIRFSTAMNMHPFFLTFDINMHSGIYSKILKAFIWFSRLGKMIGCYC